MGKRQKENTIAVTGTNGKTTVVNLIQKIFTDPGLHSVACGNVGLPLLDTIQLSHDRQVIADETIRVIEVSSFQLERTKTFKPHTGVLLNITPLGPVSLFGQFFISLLHLASPRAGLLDIGQGFIPYRRVVHTGFPWVDQADKVFRVRVAVLEEEIV